ncbi:MULTISPECIES: FUSC family protein [Methylobacterium]|uniref:p-hydroxybenzoic acid efflux pump subunit AaeB n=6 Tax=Pseudomonadota TaxID=1224 RepID=A0ABQ4SX35_9HYPH|nr:MULTISPECIES: FUSC family protein [Methylobacterium]PIU08364.1 MAG: FUSC family protein [Methylobacterium sp. CG09_land_8_20_14_0_10_71_15]PIU13545.1 MAG: FUSC family protein [Methylobacterium sp. CG08_land_8_20_14_0_20_71_15]GBU18724.1 fusaric acid resistance protein [Methylobacterium sp.]GJE07769.1 p-hydroxybenzoic acid efflux pump subunit AaeB [Methylobacterium jeotgali]
MSEAVGTRLDRALDLAERVVPPPSAWAFAARIWLAMVLALYAAFWLQLDSAGSAMVCVAILAQPKRGQALSKALYRFLGTLIGGAVSIVLVAAFGQDRVLMLVGFTAWLSLCVFAANYLQDTRAYGAMLSGYTVAIIAIAHLDAPQQAFDAALARVAAITVGIAAITFINDALASPSTWQALRRTLDEAVATVSAFAVEAVERGDPGPVRALAMIRLVAPMRADASAIAGELDDGPQRAAGARSALAGLYAMIAAARTFPAAAAAVPPGSERVAEARAICARLVPTAEPEAFEPGLARLRVLFDAATHASDPDPAEVLALRRALDLATAAFHVRDGARALATGRRPVRDARLPTHRDFPVALRAAARIALAFGLSAAFFVATGWPATTFALVQVAATGALSALNPDPKRFAVGVLIGMSLSAACAGFVLFVVLAGAQGFPLLAIAIAPVVFLACFLSLHPPTFGVGFILLVFFPVLLGPSNPQSYDLQAFLSNALLVIVAALILAITVRLVLPVTPHQARAFAFGSARGSLRSALAGEGGDATTRTSLNSDRLAQFAQWNTGRAPAQARRLELAFALAHLEACATRTHAALDRLPAGFGDAADRARAALAVASPGAMAEASAGLLRRAREAEPGPALDLATAATDLAAAGRVISRHGRFLRRFAARPA